MPIPNMLDYVHRISSLTHRHPRSLIACGFYCILARELLEGVEPLAAYYSAINISKAMFADTDYAVEMASLGRVLSGAIHELPEADIMSGGYVIHTLESSIWCLLNSYSFEEAVLKAANLGDDTDTTGCVTGGLAGIAFGLGKKSEEWKYQVARFDDIDSLFNAFCGKL